MALLGGPGALLGAFWGLLGGSPGPNSQVLYGALIKLGRVGEFKKEAFFAPGGANSLGWLETGARRAKIPTLQAELAGDPPGCHCQGAFRRQKGPKKSLRAAARGVKKPPWGTDEDFLCNRATQLVFY